MSDEMDEIWALYLDDGTQSLDQMEAALLALQDGNPDAAGEHVSALFRAVHTFKGNSRVLGLAVVESRAHVAEDLIGLVRDEGVPLDDEIIEILLYAGDVLREMLEQTSANRADVDPAASEDLMDQMRDKVARCKGETPTAAAPAHDPVVEPEAEDEDDDEEETVVAAGDIPPPVAQNTVDALFAELGAGSDDDYDDEGEEDALEVVAEEPVVETPVEVAEPTPVAAAPVEDTRPVQSVSKRLIDDPTYRDIFRGMADKSVGKFRNFMSDFAADVTATHAAARKEADDLHHAATQMGLSEWAELLEAYMGLSETDADTGVEQLAALVLRIEELTRLDLTDEPIEMQSGTDGTFFDTIKDALAALSAAGLNWSVGEEPNGEAVKSNASEIHSAAEGRGLIRVADAAKRIAEAKDAKEFRTAELRLYEELAAVESVLTEEAAASSISPTELLRSWCAEHAFDTISAVDAALSGLKKGDSPDANYSAFSRQMRLIFHACLFHKLDTAAQLSMSLIDLFGRVQTSRAAPDGILMHIARGFIDTIELVFDALEQGEIPDTQNLDILFEQASNAAFSQEGVMTATAIERRLQLPDEFHRVLSPESVRAASACIEAGHHFYVIRTDINDKEDLAEKFLEWVSGNQIKSITNVTVFRDADTLFDFLVASPLDQTAIVAQLSEMDLSGKFLTVQHVLVDTAAAGGDFEITSSDKEDAPISQGPGLTAEMLETISEVAASQAMVNHMLSDLAETGLVESVEAALRSAEQNPEQSRQTVRRLVSDFSARLHEAVQVEAQLVSQMAHLQEQTVAIRSRPMEMLIRPLEALVETLSRKNRTEAKVTSAGGQMSIDVTLMEHLRKMLRVLLTKRVSGEGSPKNIHMAFHRDDERVLVTIEDDGAVDQSNEIAHELDVALKSTSSELRQIPLPGGRGMRFHISMPMAMVVLEGMVVGVGGIRYVIPVDTIQSIIQPSADALRSISAADGRMVLRMEDGKMVTVHCMKGKCASTLKSDKENGQRHVFVVLGVGDRMLAVPVDELMGQQLVLLRPLRGVLRQMRNLTGIALLAGGEVGMVLSTNSLMDNAVEAA